MPKPFAAFDVDGTIFKSSLVEKLADECLADGIFAADAFARVAEKRRQWQRHNNEDNYQSYLADLVGTFITSIAGIKVERLNQITDRMLEKHVDRKFRFPQELLKALRTTHHPIAISGSPVILIEPFLRDLPFEVMYGSTFEIRDGKFTGNATPVGDKASILKRLVSKGKVAQENSVAVGDTISDGAMLKYADTAVMFNATRTLTEYGKRCGWVRVNEIKDQITVLRADGEKSYYSEQSIEEFMKEFQRAK